MRVPLSWLRDFAPFEGDSADAGRDPRRPRTGRRGRSSWSARASTTWSWPGSTRSPPSTGADKIRQVVVDAGGRPGRGRVRRLELRRRRPGPAGPGRGRAARRVRDRPAQDEGRHLQRHALLGRELGLSDDHEGILVAHEVDGRRRRARPLAEALGIEPDVVFDIAVEANRPDAWCMAGVARDLAARLRPAVRRPGPSRAARRRRRSRRRTVGSLTTVRVEDLELCPRFTARVLTGVAVGPSPALAGPPADPGRDAADQQRGRRLQLRDARARPAHPPLRPRPAGRRRPAGPAGRGRGRRVVPPSTASSARSGRPARASATPAQDCLICDATDAPVGIGGVMGGASSEIGRDHHPGAARGGLLRRPWPSPARPSAWACAPRPRPASSGGAIPAGIDRAAAALLRAAGREHSRGSRWPTGRSTCWAPCPRPPGCGCGQPG